MLMSSKREDEREFLISGDKGLEDVLNLVWPASDFIDVDGMTAWRRSTRLARAVHCFPERERPDVKDRLKIFLGGKSGNRVCTQLDRKTYCDGLKTEEVVQTAESKKQSLKLLRALPPLTGALVKERATLLYHLGVPGRRNGRAYKLKVGIDRIVFFSLEDFACSRMAYHIEFEGDGHGSEVIFCDSEFFGRSLAPKLIPLKPETSKWKIAEGWTKRACNPAWGSYEAIRGFHDRAIGLLSAEAMADSAGR